MLPKNKMMKNSNNKIDVFALTDCHQEARKLCCLFSGIMARAADKGRNTLICDCGDLFKGIYDKNLCVDAYLKLRNKLPEAKIVVAVGNNDFGFNNEGFDFLVNTAKKFNQANIHFLCANIIDSETGKYPKWVDPYILLEINGKRILITAFCFNMMKMQRYGLKMIGISEAFTKMLDTVKYIDPDAFIVLNHALLPSSLELSDISIKAGINIDLLIGGHEHSVMEPIADKHIYYPQAFSRNMLRFNLDISSKPAELTLSETISSKAETLNPIFAPELEEFEQKAGLNIPVAKSTLNLTRDYSNPCPLGTFVADLMKSAAKTQIAMISTGYMTHALRYEKDKILTMYNIERAYSAETLIQTADLHAEELKAIFNNALRIRYTQRYGNTRFLQCSQNISVYCKKGENNAAEVVQIIINGEKILDENGKSRHPQETISCAFDPYIGAGELGFDIMRTISKNTLMKDNKLVKIKELFIAGIKEAENKYPAGSSYPSFKIYDIES